MTHTFLLFHGRIPSEKAAALWAAKTAEALADAGQEVTLVASRRGVDADVFEAYGLRRNFSFIRLRAVDLFALPGLRWFVFSVSVVSFSLVCLLYLLRNAKRTDVIFSNEPLILGLASLFFPNCFCEVHVFPERKQLFFRWMFSRMRGIVAITQWLADETGRVFGIPKDRITVARSGVEVGEFAIATLQEEARARLGLPADAPIALYTGHLYAWKGVDTLAAAAAQLSGVQVIFVGGTPDDIAAFRKKYTASNIRIVGHVPHQDVALWQKAADVLVLPNTARENISKYYTSPMKLFEYMASGTPIVASRLPSIAEILSDETAVLVEPDNAEALAAGIRRILENRAHGAHLAAHARKDIERFSWKKRGELIAHFMSV